MWNVECEMLNYAKRQQPNANCYQLKNELSIRFSIRPPASRQEPGIEYDGYSRYGGRYWRDHYDVRVREGRFVESSRIE